MLVAVTGPAGSGRATIRRHLRKQHAFQSVGLEQQPACLAEDSNEAPKDEVRRFTSEGALLDYATAHWSSRLLIDDDFSKYADIDAFRKRPFFLLVSVSAPVLVRWQRIQHAAPCTAAALSLEKFLEIDDYALFSPLSADAETGVAASAAAAAAVGAATPINMSREESSGVIATLTNMAVAVGAATLSKGDGATLQGTSIPSQGESTLKEGGGNGVSTRRPLSLYELMQTADLRILNDFRTSALFAAYLSTLDLSATHRLRPSWDTYFVSLCTLASLRSNCMKRRVGAVLVRNNRVLSTGYNGTPRGLRNCNEGGCARCNGRLVQSKKPGAATLQQEGAMEEEEQEQPQVPKSGVSLDECLCLHAEENALLECGREKGGAEGTVLYCNTCPCLRCAVKIVQTGVKEVVYQLAYSMDDRSREIFDEAGVRFRKYVPPI
ncbi:hypothetical protein K437DRAFT_254018 [Tilletiaria anomala UBC 951]|uniref:Deoxycytidylate deaminase n=1 Tax=Tilletiaria anomala (strain ATCC 24038 / CBS 436.72 / UBC 951) TaxID=1037660 RepID=A0A066WF61_TILAU|nr:uncharacterized protein K437DRAFT_254018 [Tilletiaria anomala UBC 951]KDN52617.1 hypothetical protein K437DRAFT_254018 [Tilletiaria anomala UBC 951]